MKIIAAVLSAAASPLAAQTDSVTVAAGPHYAAEGLTARLLGRVYRDLWTTPIRVPVLDLGTVAGGLTPVRRGSGLQTISLRLRGADGREYNFRSVDKDQTGGLHPDFQNTLIDRLAQDQVSSKHPAAALVTDTLLDAAGVLHPEPRLYVMPDDPRLGEFREEFAGMLGMLEVHPNEGERGEPLFAGAAEVADTEDLLEHLDSDPRHRVDSRDFLRARLVDLLVGDWDRHPDQWRWARYERGGAHRWVPVPEDRDNAFANYDGLLLDVARRSARHLVEFEAAYPDLFGLTANAQPLDRRLLSGLSLAAFDTVAADLRRRLTDEVIRAAVRAMPPEYFALRGEEMIRELQARRDALPAAARAFYAQLATEVDVRATDAPELAEIYRFPDGALEVRLFAPRHGTAPREPYFRRRFLPWETREVRLYLQGGNDTAVVRWDEDDGVLLRVIGGKGDDLFADSSRVGGSRTRFYDSEGENRLVGNVGGEIDTREFTPPDPGESGFNENRPAFRDWGSEIRIFQPWAEWRYNVGLVVGGGPVYTRYGFRRVPFASRWAVRALYAPFESRLGLELAAERRLIGSRTRLSLQAVATQLEVTRFHGFGNATRADRPSSLYKVWETRFRVAPLYHAGVGEDVALFAGPVLQYTLPDPEPGGPADRLEPFGSESFGQAGAQAGAVLDTRDLPSFPRRGAFAVVRASAFPGLWEAPGAFGGIDALAATYVPLRLRRESTLALRAGGAAAWGEFPLQEAAFLGGSESLRGFPRQRFAGDAALFGGAELRTFLTRFNFISRGDLGLIGLADAGRVYVDGESPGGWHAAVGAGVWVGVLDRTRTLSLVVARGEETALYLSFGMPF